MSCAVGLGPIRSASGFEDGGYHALSSMGEGQTNKKGILRAKKGEMAAGRAASSVLSLGIPLGDRDCGQEDHQLFQDVLMEGRVTFQ